MCLRLCYIFLTFFPFYALDWIIVIALSSSLLTLFISVSNLLLSPVSFHLIFYTFPTLKSPLGSFVVLPVSLLRVSSVYTFCLYFSLSPWIYLCLFTVIVCSWRYLCHLGVNSYWLYFVFEFKPHFLLHGYCYCEDNWILGMMNIVL